jgi:hypothetical protein
MAWKPTGPVRDGETNMKHAINRQRNGFVGAVLLGLATSAYADDKDRFEAAYQAAENARQQAAASGFEWRDTEEVLAQSKASANAGDYAQALKLANQAQRESDLAIEQAATEAEAWKLRVIK